MFKKCILAIIIVIGGIFLRGNIIEVKADTQSDVTQVSSTDTIPSGEKISNKKYVVTCSLSSVFSISSDCVIENVTVVLSTGAKVNGAIFEVCENAKVVFKNIKITSEDNVSCARLIRVESGATAELDGFEADVDTKYIAKNSGTLILKKFKYTGTSKNGLQNDTKNLVLGETNIEQILLNPNACITVNENTKLDNNLQIVLPNNTFESEDTIVKGDGIFASYFMDKISLVEDDKFGLEYFGASDEKSANVGDIFLVEKKDNVIAYANATCASYLKNNTGTIKYNDVVLDNYNRVATKNITTTTKAVNISEECVTLSVKSSESNVNYNIGKNGSWLIFLDNYGDSKLTSSENITVTEIYTCSSHSAVLVTHKGEELQAKLIVKETTANTPSEPTTPNETEETTDQTKSEETIEPEPTTPSEPEPTTPVPVDLVVNETMFEYDGSNRFEDIKVWYVLEGETYYLQLEEKEIKNVGDYTLSIVFTEESENYGLVTLSMESIEVKVTQKKITPYLETSEFVYNGTVPELNILFNGLVNGDEVIYTLTQDENFNVTSEGHVAQVMLEENINYTIENGKECVSYIILKATIDEKDISFTDIHKVYDGKQITFNNEKICNDLILVEYASLHKEIVNKGTYIVNISLELLDKNNYNPLVKSEYSIQVIISPKEIVPTLSTCEFEYSGSTPDLIFSFKNVLNEDKIKYSLKGNENIYVGKYEVEISLDETDTTTSNYFILTSNAKHEYEITKKLVDTSGVKFNDQERVYGEEINIAVENLPEGIRVTYLNIQDFVVGEYEIVASFELEDSSNYKLDKPSICMILTVTKKEVDISSLKFKFRKYIYDGEFHSLNEEDISLEGVKFGPVSEYSYKDAGKYEIVYELAPLNDNYKLVGKEDMYISGMLEITEAEYDISAITFSDTTLTYDTLPHTINYVGTLPEGLETLKTDEYVNAGNYTITLTFVNSNPNYFTPKSKTAVLNISPKEVSVALKESTFVYSGNMVNLVCDITGVLGDHVEVELDYPDCVDAGEYVATIVSLSNPNYISTTESLDYTISKAPSKVSGLNFKDVDFTYNGEVYKPCISGTMPSYLTYEIISNKEIKNAGVYHISVKFTADKNHIAPEDLHAMVTIHKKEVTVEFSNYLDLKYTGRNQYIDVDIKGMLDQEKISTYYNETPNEAGTYTCTVSLEPTSNYVITGDDTCVFNIYLEKKTSTNDEYTVSVEGALFNTSSELSVKTLSLSKTNEQTLQNSCKNLDGYECFEICSESKTNAITYQLSLNSLNLSKGNYTLYQLESSGEITEISYTLNGNSITFTAPTNSTFILAKSKTPSSISLYLILLSILLTITLTTTLLLCIKKRKKNRVRDK